MGWFHAEKIFLVGKCHKRFYMRICRAYRIWSFRPCGMESACIKYQFICMGINKTFCTRLYYVCIYRTFVYATFTCAFCMCKNTASAWLYFYVCDTSGNFTEFSHIPDNIPISFNSGIPFLQAILLKMPNWIIFHSHIHFIFSILFHAFICKCLSATVFSFQSTVNFSISWNIISTL